MIAPRIAYLVVRASMTPSSHTPNQIKLWEDMHFQPRHEDEEGPVRVPEVVYAKRGAAESECERRALAARELLNPFWLGDLATISSMEGPHFRAQVSKLGVVAPPPKLNTYDHSHLVAWWEVGLSDWTDAQRTAIWDLFDRIRLFEVVEIELE